MSAARPDRTGPPWRTAEEFWEDHYEGMSAHEGGPNPFLIEVASDLSPGTALDLGCGGGGDAVWLAKRGWDVTAVDVSPTALVRVADRAKAAGLHLRVRVEHHDLAATTPGGAFDLISAQYLHSPVTFDRSAALRRVAAHLRVGGLLLIVDHASDPPWSWANPTTVFPSPKEAVMAIGLDEWHVVRADAPQREAVGPGGRHAPVTDNVIVLTKEPR